MDMTWKKRSRAMTSTSASGVTTLAEETTDVAAHRRQQVLLEPRIGREPGIVAPRRMRQRDAPGRVRRGEPHLPFADGLRHALAAGRLEVPALGVASDQQHKLQLRHGGKQAAMPGGGAFAPRRQVAARCVVAW